MARKKVLGKGFDALIGDAVEDGDSRGSGTADQVLWVSIDELRPNPDQPRENFDSDNLEELADSIRSQGIIQPLVVEQDNTKGYMIIAGERRWRASHIAGVDRLPVLVRNYTDEQRIAIALIENIQREDLSPMEEARAYSRLMEEFDLLHQEIASRVGKSRVAVTNSLRLLKLPETIQVAIDNRSISPGHARAILSVGNPVDQTVMFTEIIKGNLSVRDTEEMASRMLNKSGKGKGNDGSLGNSVNPGSADSDRKNSGQENDRWKNPDMERIEQQFIEVLGTKVTLKGSLTSGKMVVSWYTKDDLDRLYSVLVDRNTVID